MVEIFFFLEILYFTDISTNSFIQFQIWDFPGQIDFFDQTFEADLIFGGCGAIVFVIDSQDDYSESITKLCQTVSQAQKVNKAILFEVFIHKIDGISDDQKSGKHVLNSFLLIFNRGIT